MAEQLEEHVGRTTRWFARFANYSAGLVGSPWVFLAALVTIALWIAAGPFFHFSNGWQLVVNSWTNIVTFIVVFLIQNSQNRDSRAINLKLDELILSIQRAQNEMINIERLTDKELEHLAERYERIRRELRSRHPQNDTHSPAA
jgi:low affinity Fe/Cu permease